MDGTDQRYQKKDREDKRFNERREVESFASKWEKDEAAIGTSTLRRNSSENGTVLSRRSSGENKSIKEAYDAWMLSGSDEENLRKVGLDDRKNSLRGFIKKHGWQSLVGVNEEIGSALRFQAFRKPQTAIGYLSDFKAFFNFCIKREWLKKSPIYNML